mmetsp:Transcript_23536/g.39976  ORF Transcript_23536/g.39976 Transcript_23536/m.39976 type:complete len:965 (-) Transcript_23536:251-3145(-)
MGAAASAHSVDPHLLTPAPCRPAGPRATLLLLPSQPQPQPQPQSSRRPQSAGATVHKCPSSPPLNSTASSQFREAVLRVVCNQELRRFVSLSWRPGAGGGCSDQDAQFQAEGRAIALNFIDFVHEASDFAKIPECGFQYYRACHIFEKFLMHGAAYPVPLRGASSRVADDCSAALYGGRADASSCCSSGLFSAAVVAALDFLLAEVVPSFEQHVPLRQLQHSLGLEVTKQLSTPWEAREGVTADWTEATAVVTGRPGVYRQAFSDFADRIADPRLVALLCTLEALENTQDLIVALKCSGERAMKEPSEDPGAAAELSMVAFLHHLHRFYTGHLLCPPHERGGPDPVCLELTDATKGDFLLKVAKCSVATPDVLLPVRMDILQQLSRRYAALFFASSEHAALVGDGHVQFRDAAPASATPSMSTGARGPGARDEASETGPAQCDRDDKAEARAMAEIAHLLGSNVGYVFGEYLSAEHQELPLMHFCQSAIRYQETARFLPDSLCEITECTNIFERFLSRNAVERMKLPEAITRDIPRLMFQPDAHLFTEALQFVLRYLAQHRWKGFKRAINSLCVAVGQQHFSREVGFSVSCHGSGDQGSGGPARMSDKPLVHFDAPASSRFSEGHQERGPCSNGEGSKESLAEEQVVTQTQTSNRKSSLISRKDGKKYTDGVGLEDIMSRSACLTIFKAYLDAEGTSQTLLFLIEVDEFQKIPETGFQQSRARKIFFKFIHSKAIMAVPLTPATRQAIEAEFSSDDISALIFSKAIQEVTRFVECHQFPRFMQSAEAESVTKIIDEEVATNTSSTDEENYIPYLRRKPSHNDDQAPWEVKSLDDMMNFRVLLKYPTAVRFFKDYCVRTHCNENLFFWLDADNYTKLPGSDFRKRVAVKLSRKYIVDDAKLQVNISGKVRLRILSELPTAGRLVFQQAQEEVFMLMQAGTYPAFLKSTEFSQLKNYFQASASSSV